MCLGSMEKTTKFPFYKELSTRKKNMFNFNERKTDLHLAFPKPERVGIEENNLASMLSLIIVSPDKDNFES